VVLIILRPAVVFSRVGLLLVSVTGLAVVLAVVVHAPPLGLDGTCAGGTLVALAWGWCWSAAAAGLVQDDACRDRSSRNQMRAVKERVSWRPRATSSRVARASCTRWLGLPPSLPHSRGPMARLHYVMCLPVPVK
jgi:hypothetical protein